MMASITVYAKSALLSSQNVIMSRNQDGSKNGLGIDAEVENNKFERIDVNLVSSYFDKNSLSKMLSEAVAQEVTGGVGIYYADKNRAKDIFKWARVQYPRALNNLNSDNIIHRIDEKVNKKQVMFFNRNSLSDGLVIGRIILKKQAKL